MYFSVSGAMTQIDDSSTGAPASRRTGLPMLVLLAGLGCNGAQSAATDFQDRREDHRLLVATALRALPIDSLCKMSASACRVVFIDHDVPEVPDAVPYGPGTFQPAFHVDGDELAKVLARRVVVGRFKLERDYKDTVVVRLMSVRASNATSRTVAAILNVPDTWPLFIVMRIDKRAGVWTLVGRSTLES